MYRPVLCDSPVQALLRLHWGQIEIDGGRLHGEDMLLYTVPWSVSKFSYGIGPEPVGDGCIDNSSKPVLSTVGSVWLKDPFCL